MTRWYDPVRLPAKRTRGRPTVPQHALKRIDTLRGKMPVAQLAEYLGLHRSTVKKYIARKWAQEFA